ncbi:MAG TPA: HlyD family efflux transporter periplasmic adaptor subunit [Pirellulales bacterium]|jgi:multidrug efflux pump subunit AcrA (membrane-fusion protein)|nr:HlyD family efflux transporter periplasmic adaptor subunit [Pirellulales bacterium]
MLTLLARLSIICLICCLIVAAPLGCRHGGDGAEAEAGSDDAPVLAVHAARAETRSLEETVDGIGRSEALPSGLVTLTPAVQGHVEAIAANLGDLVRRGDVIVELDPTVAKADVAERQANRDTLKAAWDLLRADPRPEDKRGLEIGVAQGKAAVARAQAALDRLQPLRAKQEVSAAQIYEAEQTLVAAQLQQQSAEAQLELLLAGPRPEAVEEGKARLEAAEGALALARAHLRLHSIRSPIDGVLDSLACHPGQTVAAGTAIGEIVDARRLNVVVWLPPPAAAKVKVGQAVRLVVGGSAAKPSTAGPTSGEPATDKPAADEPTPDEPMSDQAAADSTDDDEPTAADHAADQPAADESADDAARGMTSDAIDDADADVPTSVAARPTGPSGKVASIGRMVDPQTGNLPVRVLVDNADGRIAVGETLSVTIVVHHRVDELVVPSTALVDLGEGPLLLVVREGKVVQLHPTSIATHGTWTIVSGTDLEPGEMVVVEGGFNLPEGTPVQVETDSPSVAEARR